MIRYPLSVERRNLFAEKRPVACSQRRTAVSAPVHSCCVDHRTITRSYGGLDIPRKPSCGGRELLLQVAILLMLLFAAAPSATAQIVTVPQLLQQKNLWEQHARDQKKFLIEGRFLSRVSESFGMEKIDLVFRHPSTIRLPDRVRRGQTLEVAGTFLLDGNRLHFQVNQVHLREMDEEQLRRRALEAKDRSPDELLKLADEYTARADFYEDDVLRQEITAVRTTALSVRREQLRGQPAQLQELLKTAEQLQLAPVAIQNITWDWLLAAEAAGEAPDSLTTSAKALPGWNQTALIPPAALADAFRKNPFRAWEQTTESNRPLLHRLLYARLQLASLRLQLKPDGSNGLAISKLTREQLPEAAAAAAEFEDLEVQWHLKTADKLNRQQLLESVQLLEQLGRQNESLQLRQRWLEDQEQRFGTKTLAGMLRTADETLFVAEQWRDPSLREKAIKLLKAAWERAAKESPAEVTTIADRLKALGWEHFRGAWMTREQMSSVPGNDLQLAAREGRVVPGMTAEQVSQILGRPTRIARLGGSSIFRELWNYEDAGLIIRLRRSLQQSRSPLLVEDVAKVR
jgi:hypothetical protein